MLLIIISIALLQGLLLEVDRAEWMVFEDRWGADHVVWEDVELLFARGSKSKSPHLWLEQILKGVKLV
jgi:hypothetical protein